nr:hypothetical protein MSCUHULR_MSCUHULR_CDS_0006 [Microvirus sp.]
MANRKASIASFVPHYARRSYSQLTHVSRSRFSLTFLAHVSRSRFSLTFLAGGLHLQR